MSEYILFFRHEDGNKVASQEQIAIWMKQTNDWITGIDSQNKFVIGKGCYFEESKTVTKNGVTDGPFGTQKETIGGYIIVKAASVNEAVEFAKGSPVLQGEGNSVEVRKLTP